MNTSGVILSLIIVIVTITLAVLTHWRKQNKERRNKRKADQGTKHLVSTKDGKTHKEEDRVISDNDGQKCQNNDHMQQPYLNSIDNQKEVEEIYTPNYSETVFCSTSLLTMNVQTNEREGIPDVISNGNVNTNQANASKTNSIKVLCSETLRKMKENEMKIEMNETDPLKSTQNGNCDPCKMENETLLGSDMHSRDNVATDLNGDATLDNKCDDWGNFNGKQTDCLSVNEEGSKKEISNESVPERDVDRRTKEGKPIISINISDEATDFEETSESGISSAGSDNREGFEFLSLLSPRKDKDDDETSSIGYSETDIDPAEAALKFPNLLIRKIIEEEYVFLRAMKHGNVTLLEHRILFVTGYPGSGKTTCAVSIIKFNRGNIMNGKSCTHKIVQNFKLYEHEYDSNDFTIVLFDDCFSSANFEDDQSVDDVGEFLAKLMRTRLTNEDVAFIFSIESETWEKLLMKFSRILSHLSYAIIDLSEGTLEPNTEEKEGILRLQIAKSGGAIVAYYKDENLHPIEKIPITLSEKNMSTILRTDSKERVGFPQLCCLLCMNMNRIRGMHDIGIFRFPRTLIYSHFEAMSKSINMDDRMGLCILMYAAIKDGCFDKYNVNLDLMDKITDKVVKCTLDLRSGLRSLRNGILVRLTRSKYIIQHKVITEILLDYIDQNNIIV